MKPQYSLTFWYNMRMSKKKNWIIIWRTRFLLLSAFITWIVYYCAFFAYQDYSSQLSYWLVYSLLIPLVTWSNFLSISLICVVNQHLIVYRL